MRSWARWVAVALFLTLALVRVTPAVAQDETEDDLWDISQLEGIESAVSRGYSVDFEALFSASPEAMESMELEGLYFVTVAAYGFDSDGNAEAAYDFMREEAATALETSGDGEEEIEVAEEEIDGLGDRAFAIDMRTESDDSIGYIRLLTVQDGDELLQVISVAGSEESATSVDAVMDVMLERESGDGEGTFNADGTSSGGLWDRFPESDDATLQGLMPFGDEQLYPVIDEES